MKDKSENGRWKHERLRSAIRSLKDNLEHLFAHRNDPYSKYDKFMWRLIFPLKGQSWITSQNRHPDKKADDF